MLTSLALDFPYTDVSGLSSSSIICVLSGWTSGSVLISNGSHPLSQAYRPARLVFFREVAVVVFCVVTCSWKWCWPHASCCRLFRLGAVWDGSSDVLLWGPDQKMSRLVLGFCRMSLCPWAIVSVNLMVLDRKVAVLSRYEKIAGSVF